MFFELNNKRYNSATILSYGINTKTNEVYLLFTDNTLHTIEGNPQEIMAKLDMLLLDRGNRGRMNVSK